MMKREPRNAEKENNKWSKDENRGKKRDFNKNEIIKSKGEKRPEFIKSEERRPKNMEAMKAEPQVLREDIIEGRNAVIEALKSNATTIEQILIAKGDTTGSISVVLAEAREKRLVVKEVDRKKLDEMSQTGVHQGVIAIVTPYKYCDVEDILEYAKKKGEDPFIIILDEIEDPHNLGAILRTAEVCGVHGVIIPKRRNVGITPTVYKTSAGAAQYMKVAKVPNINSVIDSLKKKGIWIYGADMDGKVYCQDANFRGATALIIGSEGRGISKLTKEKCDLLVKIPMVGQITSLNASVAGGILMYEILTQRMK